MMPAHFTIHALTDGDLTEATVRLGGIDRRCLVIDPTMLTEPFPVSFDEALGCLELLDRMYCEPDGSFLWVSPSNHSTWQLEGVVYDRERHVQHIEVRGHCDRRAFGEFLKAFRHPPARLAFQWMHEGVVFLIREHFRMMFGEE